MYIAITRPRFWTSESGLSSFCRASVLSIDAVEPDRSDIPKDLAAVIADLPGIRRNSRGQPIAVPEVAVTVTLEV